MKFLVTCIVVILSVVMEAAHPLQAQQAEFQKLLGEAKQATEQGKYESAARSLAKAEYFAKIGANNEWLASANFAMAMNLRAWSASGVENAPKSPDLIRHYDIVVQHGKGVERRVAANNLGVIYLKANNTKEALRIFAAGDAEGANSGNYYFNYGRALGQAGQFQPALSKYWQSIRLQPRDPRPSLAVASLLVTKPELPNRFVEALRLLRFHEEQKTPLTHGLMGPILTMLIPSWRDEAQAKRMLEFVPRYLALGQIDADRFRELLVVRELVNTGDSAALLPSASAPELGRLSKSAAAAAPLKELQQIYSGQFTANAPKLFHEEFEVWQQLPAWTTIFRQVDRVDASPLASVLSLAGDSFLRRGAAENGTPTELKQALQRFTAAYALNPMRVEPALQAVRILADHAKLIDEKGELLNQYADWLFSAKNDLLGKATTRNEVMQLQTLHIVLATIFEQKGMTGTGPKTPHYQWTEAIRDEGRLRKLDPTFPVDQNLRVRLAEATLENGRTGPDTAEMFLQAAQFLLSHGNPTRAAEVLDRVGELQQMKKLQLNEKQDPGRLWTVAENTKRLRLKWDLRQPSAVQAVALSDQGDRLIVGNTDRIRDYYLFGDVAEPIGPKQGFEWNKGKKLTWLSGTPYFISAQGQDVTKWHGSNFTRPDAALVKFGKPVHDFTIGLEPNEQIVASLFGTGEVIIKSVRFPQDPPTVPDLDGESIRSVVLSRDGKFLFMGGRNAIHVWDLESKKLRRPIATNGDVVALSVSIDNLLASSTTKGAVELWDARSGERARNLPLHTGGIVGQLQFAPRSSFLLGVDGTTVRLWNAKQGVEFARFGSALSPKNACFSADGTSLAVGFGNSTNDRGLVRIWDLGGLLRE